MTLAEAIADIDRQLNTFLTVYMDTRTFDMIERATGGNDEWSGMHVAKYRLVKNKYGEWVYAMRPGNAEEIRDAARAALARQVTEKLVGPA